MMGIKKTLRSMSQRPETRTLLELYVGVLLLGTVILIIGLIFARPMWMYALGVVAGTATAMVQLYNMYDTLDRALSADEGKARSYITSKSMLRLILMAVVMVVAYFIGFMAFLGVVLGLFTVKLSALINPWIKKHLPDFR